LWVASTDYSGEIAISDEILKRVVEAYRRIRNTLRFLLANTSDFDPAKDAVAMDAMVELDRYAINDFAATVISACAVRALRVPTSVARHSNILLGGLRRVLS
jgi:isoleucyl-tRNA synthetase